MTADHGDRNGVQLGPLGRLDDAGFNPCIAHFGCELGITALCNYPHHPVRNTGREEVGPIRDGLVCDAHSFGGGGNCSAEDVDGFLFQHFSIKACFQPTDKHAFLERATFLAMSYGTRLDIALKLANKTRKALSTEIGVSEQAIGLVIRGASHALTAENSAKAARFLRVDPFWLATGDGEPRPNAGWPFLSFGPSEFFALDPSLREEVEDRLLGAIVRTRGRKTE